MANHQANSDRFNRAYEFFLGWKPDAAEKRFAITHLKSLAEAAGGVALIGVGAVLTEIQPWEVKAAGWMGVMVGGTLAVNGVSKAYKNMVSPLTIEETNPPEDL